MSSTSDLRVHNGRAVPLREGHEIARPPRPRSSPSSRRQDIGDISEGDQYHAGAAAAHFIAPT
jgi:hypothetical protein